MDDVPANHVSSCQPPLKDVAAQLIRYHIYIHIHILSYILIYYTYMHLQRQRSGNDPMSEIHDHDQDKSYYPLKCHIILTLNHWTLSQQKVLFQFQNSVNLMFQARVLILLGVPHATFLAAYPMEGRLARLKSMNSTVDGCFCSRICLNRADEARRKDWTCHGMSPAWHPEEFRNQ